MTSFGQLREETNRIGAEFLFTELDSASTFLDVADTTGSEEGRHRNRNSAMTAYSTAIRLRDRVIMPAAQKDEFDRRLSALTTRLAGLGFNVS